MKESKGKYSSSSWLAMALLASMMIWVFPINYIHGHTILTELYFSYERADFLKNINQDELEIPDHSPGDYLNIKSHYCSLCNFIFSSNYVGSANTFRIQGTQAAGSIDNPDETLVPLSKPLVCFNKGSPRFANTCLNTQV